MIKSITPYKQCEVWGGYNSIRWSWEDTLIKRKKRYALCIYGRSAPLCTLRWLTGGGWEGAARRWENHPFSALPLLARRSTALSIITSSRISPRLLVWCFFFLFFSPDHTVHTTDSDQRAASKPEQETRAKGALSSFYLSPFPHFSTLLFKQLRRAECWARQCLPEPSCTLFTFPFTLSR